MALSLQFSGHNYQLSSNQFLILNSFVILNHTMHNEHNSPISRRDIHADTTKRHIEEITREFKNGFEFLKKYPKSVTIYGSARAKQDSKEYKLAEQLGHRIVKELKYAVVTGGGPGIMEAAHKGAREAGGHAVALGISLPHEMNMSHYANDRMQFTYFFSRKTMLTFIQTRKVPSVPVILIGSHFWNDLANFIDEKMLQQQEAIADYDRNIFKITDNIDHVIDAIRTAPVSLWWRNIN